MGQRLMSSIVINIPYEHGLQISNMTSTFTVRMASERTYSHSIDFQGAG